MADTTRNISRCNLVLALILSAGAASVTPVAAFATTAGLEQQAVQTPAAATREIRPGQTIVSTLPQTRADGGPPFEDFRIRLEAGHPVRIDMDSPPPEGQDGHSDQRGFDTYIELRPADSDIAIRENDDSPGRGLNSRIIFTAPTTGDYVIRARPLGGISDGQVRVFSVTVTALAVPPPPTEFSGATVEGALGPDSPLEESYEAVRYVDYWFEGTAGQRVQFDMRTTGLRPSMQLADGAGAVLASDLSRDENNVRVFAALPETGRYRLRAQVPQDRAGSFVINMRRVSEPDPDDPARIVPGTPIPTMLRLESNASVRADGSGQIEFFYELFELRVRAREPVTVTVTSAEFDPALEAGTLSELGFIPALSDTDPRMNNARIVIQPLKSGTVALRVRSQGLDVGAYTIEVRPGVSRPAD